MDNSPPQQHNVFLPFGSEADDDQIDHLIFFIHGVGGVCDVRFRSCVEVVADFKKMANDLLNQRSNPSSGTSTPSSLSQFSKRGSFFRKFSSDSNHSSSNEQIDINSIPSMSSATNQQQQQQPQPPANPLNRNRKVECLPVSWHSCTRRQIGINDQLSLISLGSVPRLRHFLNKVVLDAILYSSGPVYAQTIINNVGEEINRLYGLFMEKHPNFNGSISLAGHSLGSVIIFDLLANQVPHNEPDNFTNSQEQQQESTRIDSDNHETTIDNKYKTSNKRQSCLNIHHQHNHQDLNETQTQEQDDKLEDETAIKKSCQDYKNLDELLKDMNLTKYASVFRKHHIDINTLLLLTDFDLKVINLPLGVRRKLNTYINFNRVSQVHSKQQPTTQSDIRNGDGTNKINNENNNNNINNNNNNNNQQQTKIFNGDQSDNSGLYLIKYPQLKFKPRCFFSFGSPMPMFLNIRGVEHISKDYKFPTCDKMLNIFHPYDPLAYRMEPLIDPRFKNIEPIQIPHHRGGKRIHVQLREGFARVGHDIKHRLLGTLRDTWSSFTRFGATGTTSGGNGGTEADVSRSGLRTEVSTSHDTTNYSPSIINSSVDSNRRGSRLTKSSSGSVDADPYDNIKQHIPMNIIASSKQKRQLKRQQQFVRSISDITNITSLSNILDNSMRKSMEESELEEFNRTSQTGLNLEARKLSVPLKPEAATTSEPETATATSETTTKKPSSDEGILDSTKTTSSKKQSKKSKSSKKRQKRKSKESELILSDEEFEPDKVGKLNGGKRLDYVLQEKPIELFNEYIFAFTSHANYWQNEDSAQIILNEIYQEDGIQMFEV